MVEADEGLKAGTAALGRATKSGAMLSYFPRVNRESNRRTSLLGRDKEAS